MRKLFKRMVWEVYRFEYKVWHSSQEPSPRISLCKLSWSMVVLSPIMLPVLIIPAMGIICVAIMWGAGWFFGFSPNIREWSKDPFCADFWKGGYRSETDRKLGNVSYYKLNKRFAPWEIILFPMIPIVWVMRRAHCPLPLDFSEVMDQPKEK